MSLDLSLLEPRIPSKEDLKECGYVLDEEIGKGFFGIAIRAKNVSTEKWNVLKVLPLDKRNRKEAQIAKVLDHPNIVKTYEYFILDRQLIFVMEELGVTLRKALEERQKCHDHFANRPAWNVKVMGNIFEALEYLHKGSLCHSDLHTKNVLTCKDNNDTAKIIDVGLVQAPFRWSYCKTSKPTGSKEVKHEYLSKLFKAKSEREVVTLRPEELISLGVQISQKSIVSTENGAYWKPSEFFDAYYLQDCQDALTIFLQMQYNLTMYQIQENMKELSKGMFWSANLINKPSGIEFQSTKLVQILLVRRSLSIEEKIELGLTDITADTFVALPDGEYTQVTFSSLKRDDALRGMWATDERIAMLLGAGPDRYFPVIRGVMAEGWDTGKVLSFFRYMESGGAVEKPEEP